MLSSLLKKLSQKRFCVIGDIMLDHYLYGSCDRISPEAPVPIVELKDEIYTLGGAGNVLKNILAFNCDIDVISVVGEDDNASIVFEELKKAGLNSSGIITDKNRITTIKTRVISASHQMIRLDKESKHEINDAIENELINLLSQKINYYDIILVSDYNKGLLTPNFLNRIFGVCRTANKKTLVDPKGTNFNKYIGANLIKPNKKEAAAATGINITDNDSLQRACLKIKDMTECDEVVVTLSEDGIAYLSDNKLHIVPTVAMDIIDVTGAGDTVLASLGLAIANDLSLKQACEFANRAAAMVVNKIGSATVSLEELTAQFTN